MNQEGVEKGNGHKRKNDLVRILIAGSQNITGQLRKELSWGGYATAIANSVPGTLSLLETGQVDVLVLAEGLCDADDGMNLLKHVKSTYPFLEVITVVNRASALDAVDRVRSGAYDCFSIPVMSWKFLNAVNDAYQAGSFRKRMAVTDWKGVQDDEFVGKSKGIQKIKHLVSLVSPSDAAVLILGERGVGKKLIAKAIHKSSDRSQGPFITVNVDGVQDETLENQLFGDRGCTEGIGHYDETGLVGMANHGTLCVNDIGKMHPLIQTRLLWVIERRVFRRFGNTYEHGVDIRLVSISENDLEKETKRRQFRSDIFYKLSSIIVQVPPLRERKEDIPLLVRYFISKLTTGGKEKSISMETLNALMKYSWPGNVWQLANMVKHAIVLSHTETVSMDRMLMDLLNSESMRDRN